MERVREAALAYSMYVCPCLCEKGGAPKDVALALPALLVVFAAATTHQNSLPLDVRATRGGVRRGVCLTLRVCGWAVRRGSRPLAPGGPATSPNPHRTTSGTALNTQGCVCWRTSWMQRISGSSRARVACSASRRVDHLAGHPCLSYTNTTTTLSTGLHRGAEGVSG